MTPTIAPSILSADFMRLGEQVDECVRAGTTVLHVDVMDGRFVPNISIGLPVLKSLRKDLSITLDVHLMIVEPEKFIVEFATQGADIITFHQEATFHHHRIVQLIHDTGKKAGLAVNPSTPLGISKEILSELDVMLIMTVNPGFGGQTFIKSMLKKIEAITDMVKSANPDCVIEIDGGVSSANVEESIAAGAEILVAGNSVFKPEQSIADNIRDLTSRFP